MTLYIINYNNYYNRILKKEETLTAYLENRLIFEIPKTNFNPNDNVITEHIVGVGNYDGSGDYVLVVNEKGVIVSRWFIIEAQRTRAGQWKLQLYRDTIADYYDNIINSPVFIEKATLSVDDPLIYNNEDMSFNEIKKSEVLLKDKTNCPWIVGYYAKNAPTSVLEGEVSINSINDIYDIIIDTPFESWKFNATETPIKTGINAVNYNIYAKDLLPNPGLSVLNLHGVVKYTSNGNYLGYEATSTSDYSLSFNKKLNSIISPLGEKIAAQSVTLYDQAKTYLSETLSDSEREEFLNLNKKIIKDSTGKYYKLTIYQDALSYETKNVSAGSLFDSLSNIVASGIGIVGTPDINSFKVIASFNNYKMLAQELTNLATTWDMTATKFTTEDAPYNIFAIPFGDCLLHDKSLLTTIAKSSKEYALPLADSIIRTMGSNLYDIQLLPYCPINDLREGAVDVKNAASYSLVKGKDDKVLTYILNVTSASFSRNIPFYKAKPESAIETKIQNECDKYRIASPNFNGFFDFTSAKNGGIEFFNVDVTLKPFQPYIHINPNFGNLYGIDYNDPRGLICGGDFSLSQYLDKWQDYQIQNKNFQEIFDRQIQNIEFNNKYQRKAEVINAITGTISGGLSGAATGLISSGGNPYAAAAGAIVGTAAAGIGGIADININDKLRTEALDFTKDQFGYQLGNIKALPYTLTKVSSFNDNNKIFPILEYYTCTDREKVALVNKLAYNGMTVMAIGRIADYIGANWSYTDETTGEKITNKGYIKARLIRLEGINEDFHIVNAISNELFKGVYIL